MFEIEYLMSKNGKAKAVVIPIEIWNKLLPIEGNSIDELSEALKDYCMNNAIDEGQKSPLLNKDEALKYLEE